MATRRLNSYKGRLDERQVANGVNVARRNARRLLEDAKILFTAQRYASAASLAILSIEELGKEPILRRLAIATNDDELRGLWKDYRTHTRKNTLWLMPQLVMEGARQLDDFRTLFENEAEHTYILEQVKQISFYTDCLGEVHWSEPVQVIEQDLATMLIQIAKVFMKDTEIQTEEIELWVKHMGGVKDSDLGVQKEALSNWFAEMQELGLTTKGRSLIDFMRWLGMDIDI